MTELLIQLIFRWTIKKRLNPFFFWGMCILDKSETLNTLLNSCSPTYNCYIQGKSLNCASEMLHKLQYIKTESAGALFFENNEVWWTSRAGYQNTSRCTAWVIGSFINIVKNIEKFWANMTAIMIFKNSYAKFPRALLCSDI